MVTSKTVMDRIKEILARKYKSLTISLLGKDMFSRADLNRLAEAGVDVSNKASLMELAYYHNLLNPQGKMAPASVEDMKAQQGTEGVKPVSEAHSFTEQHVNETMRLAIEKLQQDVTARIVGYINDNNQGYKYNALQNLERQAEANKLVKESTLHKLKQRLRDSSKDANRDWLRIATTELSNTIGAGSVDRIAHENKGKDAGEIYVYRIVVNDGALCKYCRRFYLDDDGSPRVYRLSTLLGNGSNFGKKVADWQPVVNATHPNERCSQVIELKRGWKVLPGGRQSYIGPDEWNEYIVNKVVK